jgi:hypothetical protein
MLGVSLYRIYTFMNIVTIDPSLISTAVVVSSGNGFTMMNYCRESDSYNKKGLSKWFKSCEEHVRLRLIEYADYSKYSEGEVAKLRDYNRITDGMLDDITALLDTSKPTYVSIEGFNYGASVGDLIDLVAFSTLLRTKILSITPNLEVLSPTTLKQEACKLAYPPVDTGKKKQKLVWRNNQGIAGGHFTKREIFQSIVENPSTTDPWSMHCRSVSEEVMSLRTIPKPYEDINDAFVMYLRMVGIMTQEK